jgi:hypothetical protein
MATVEKIERSMGEYLQAIRESQGDFAEFMVNYQRLAEPILRAYQKQAQTLAGCVALQKETDEPSVNDAISYATKKATLRAMREAGLLAPEPEAVYTVWDREQCAYIADTAGDGFSPNYIKANAYSLSAAIDAANLLQSFKHDGPDHSGTVVVLDRDECEVYQTIGRTSGQRIPQSTRYARLRRA